MPLPPDFKFYKDNSIVDALCHERAAAFLGDDYREKGEATVFPGGERALQCGDKRIEWGGESLYIRHYVDGKNRDPDGNTPANISYYGSGFVRNISHCYNGVAGNTPDGRPCEEAYYDGAETGATGTTGSLRRIVFRMDGDQCDPSPGSPSAVSFYPSGAVENESYFGTNATANNGSCYLIEYEEGGRISGGILEGGAALSAEEVEQMLRDAFQSRAKAVVGAVGDSVDAVGMHLPVELARGHRGVDGMPLAK